MNSFPCMLHVMNNKGCQPINYVVIYCVYLRCVVPVRTLWTIPLTDIKETSQADVSINNHITTVWLPAYT